MVQAGTDASPASGAVRYERHRPETTLLYQLVDAHYPAFTDQMAMHGTPLPEYVERELEDYLKCGRLEHGFLRVRCVSCHAEHLVAFSCKRRGFCPSCGARRMAESAALLVDEVLPEAPMRQWVLSFPFPLRFLFASRPEIMGQVLSIVYRALASHLIRKAGYTATTARTGAVTLIQRISRADVYVHHHGLRRAGNHGVAIATAGTSCGTVIGVGASSPVAEERAKASMIDAKSVPALPKKYSMPRSCNSLR